MSILNRIDKEMPVLIVDDFAIMRKILKACLKQIGFSNFAEAEDGKMALEKLQEGEFQLVISDWNMPKMMGIDLLRAVRADERLKDTPFLMVTAEGKKENVVQAAKAGVSNYIVKPFTPDAMSRKLELVFLKHQK